MHSSASFCNTTHPSQFSEQKPASTDQEYRGDSTGQHEVGTDRIEAFSDAVFAIAITLLILAVANRIGLPIRGYIIALHPIA